jgi:hypothetical protein
MANIKFSAFTQLAPIDQTNSYIVGYEGDANTNNRWTFGEVAIGLKAVTATPYSIYSASGALEATREVTFSAHDLKFIATGNGKLWYQDGNQAAGKVLKSNGDGEASWAVETDTNTTYDLTAPSVGTLRLTGSDSTTDDISISGGTGINITQNAADNINIVNSAPNQATPAAGSSGQLQYNDGSNGFTATSDMVYTTDQLKVQNTLYLDGNGPAGGGSGNAGIVKLGCEAAGASHYVGLEGPTHGGANAYTIKFPDATPTANQILKVNTVASSTANMVWAADTDTNTNIANTNLNLDASRTLGLGADQNLTFTGSGTSKVTFSNLGGVEIARDLTVQRNVIIQGQGYSELNAMTANTFAPDWNIGNVQSVTLTQASTFAPTNPKAGATYILIVTNTNAAITWGSYIKWAAPDTQAAPPELSGSGKTDVITLICYDGSTTNGLYYGSITKDLS